MNKITEIMFHQLKFRNCFDILKSRGKTVFQFTGVNFETEKRKSSYLKKWDLFYKNNVSLTLTNNSN